MTRLALFSILSVCGCANASAYAPPAPCITCAAPGPNRAWMPPETPVVIIGDSIVNRWNTGDSIGGVTYPGIPSGVTALGIDGMRVLEFAHQDIPAGTKTVVMAMGTNDCGRNDPIDDIVAAYQEAIDDVLGHVPTARIVVSLVMPTTGQPATRNVCATELNARLILLGYEVLDAWSILACSAGTNAMCNNVHADGVHLNNEGYRLWRILLDAWIRG